MPTANPHQAEMSKQMFASALRDAPIETPLEALGRGAQLLAGTIGLQRADADAATRQELAARTATGYSTADSCCCSTATGAQQQATQHTTSGA